ncbi:GFA family protein [Bradyrhizobium diazoefficiens]|nr:GFA family protein [Bradyrhizobium diazoefficiens]MBR0778610.1 GFA family protein [Bradyrhizobium diazoefficiens]
MIEARCSCGAVAVSLPGPTDRVAACHCIACQRRSGAPFGVGAFYPLQSVEIRGTPKEYVRAADSGGKVRCYFCTECGSTVYWKADNLPAMIGVALGAIADPNFPAPIKSVFEQSKHGWVEIGGAAVEHLQQGSFRKNSG